MPFSAYLCLIAGFACAAGCGNFAAEAIIARNETYRRISPYLAWACAIGSLVFFTLAFSISGVFK